MLNSYAALALLLSVSGLIRQHQPRYIHVLMPPRIQGFPAVEGDGAHHRKVDQERDRGVRQARRGTRQELYGAHPSPSPSPSRLQILITGFGRPDQFAILVQNASTQDARSRSGWGAYFTHAPPPLASTGMSVGTSIFAIPRTRAIGHALSRPCLRRTIERESSKTIEHELNHVSS